MKTLLIHPIVRAQDRPRHVPYGISQLAAVTAKKHETAICDMNIARELYSTEDDIIEYELTESLKSTKWDCVGVGGLSSQYAQIKRILPIIRKTNPNTLIIGGGGWSTYLPNEMLQLNPEIDIICVGESEETIQEILDGRSPKDIRGIYYREDGQIIATQPRPLIEHLDSIPFPNYDLLEMELYFKNSSSMESKESMMAKRRTDGIYERGCPRSCKFCCHNGMSRHDLNWMLGKERVRELDKEAGYFQNVARWNSPKYIVEHMWFLKNEYNCDYLTNMDENLTSNKKRTFDLCDLIISEGLHKAMGWGCLGDAGSVTDEMVKKLKEANCNYISFGGESSSSRILKTDIGKGLTREDNQRAVDIMYRQQMRPIMTFQIGFPTETIDDMMETLDFFIVNNIRNDVFIDCPYPGSPYYYEHNDHILQQYDPTITKLSPKEKKLKALELFCIDLSKDATELMATVWQAYPDAQPGDLIWLKWCIANNDPSRLLYYAHLKGWNHSQKWEKYCTRVCQQTRKLIIGANEAAI